MSSSVCAPQVAEIVLNANGDPGRFAAFGLPLVADRLAGQMGPLAGIHAGLAWAKANRPEQPLRHHRRRRHALLPRRSGEPVLRGD